MDLNERGVSIDALQLPTFDAASPDTTTLSTIVVQGGPLQLVIALLQVSHLTNVTSTL